jgi:hypothetical protein
VEPMTKRALRSICYAGSLLVRLRKHSPLHIRGVTVSSVKSELTAFYFDRFDEANRPTLEIRYVG